MALILTLGFDSASFARLEPLRERHFPAARNFLPVHVTLFQQLPDAALLRILGDLAAAAARTTALPFAATGIRAFGRGAAVEIACPAAQDLHAGLRRNWSDLLTDSDDRARQLHVTVQNRADRDLARATLAELRAGFSPWRGLFDRLLLWHYRGGPWERAGTFPFSGDSA